MAGDDGQPAVRIPRWTPEVRPHGWGGDVCPKCRFAGTSGHDPPESDWRCYVWVPQVDAQRWLGESSSDVIVVACRRCNYRWIELPADADPGVGPN